MKRKTIKKIVIIIFAGIAGLSMIISYCLPFLYR